MDAAIVAFLSMTAIGLTSWYLSLGIGFVWSFVIGQILGVVYQKYVVQRHAVPKNAAVLITGCSSGIGFDGAVHLSKLGFHILAGVRKLEDADPLISACKGGRVFPVILDVAKSADIESSFKKIEEYLQTQKLSLIALVNNAGYPETSVMELIDMENLRKQFEVNVFGQVAVSQAYLPLLRKSSIAGHSPRLIFMSSCVGWMTVPAMGAYCASKHAIESIGDAFRMELQSWGIDVVIIEPGSIRSKFNKVSKETMKSNFSATHSAEKARYNQMCNVMMEKQIIMEKVNFGTEYTDAALEAALLDKVPLTRYRVGLDAMFGMPLIIHLPDRLTDIIFARFFKKA